ncbi:PREDICTED: insulin-like growth factor II [Papilio polytes]|uniref:insulin-like growth factor II n=1 Tax=Papilio polytes TaxID=76194 RepID=UPI0006760AF0|nr:PREDICTED: insulin-like growth factor II [Papilio polytes]
MLFLRRVQMALLVFAAGAAMCGRADAASAAMKLCGRNLGVILSRVCSEYNSPAWDVPTVIEQTAGVVRRKRETGIVYECCTQGCTYEHLSEYCATTVKATSETSVDSHMIEDRCRCRGRRSRRRRPTLMGNMHIIKSAARAAPVVGTVSPLLTWGRTLNTDLPTVDNDRYAYVIYA